MEISVTEVLVTMSAERDWLSIVASASDKASDAPVPEAEGDSTSTCKYREKEVAYSDIWMRADLSKDCKNVKTV